MLFAITNLRSMFRLRRNQVCTSRNWKSSQREILSKGAGPFLKISFFSRCFSHMFATGKQLPGFSISRLVSGEIIYFLMYIDFLNVNIYVIINDYLFKYIYVVCYLKFCFYCLTCSALSKFNSADFAAQNSHRDFNSQNRNAAWILK